MTTKQILTSTIELNEYFEKNGIENVEIKGDCMIITNSGAANDAIVGLNNTIDANIEKILEYS